MPCLGSLLLGGLGSIAAFITTVNAARYLSPSLKLAVESLFLSMGWWAGSELERIPFCKIACICADELA